ncbi:recombinase family protein, partial [Klebsiella pneumoniae]
MGHRAAIYCRVSTADQSCERQEFDLRAFAGCAGYDVVGIFKETGSGTKLDRAERKKVLALAQSRQIGTVAKLAMRQPFVLFKGLTFQKLCLPGAFR